MPCYDGREHDYRSPPPEMHNHPLAEMLCKVIRENPKVFLDGPTMDWWHEHKERDAQRAAYLKQQEEYHKMRQAALEKLSPGERRLLGLS